MSRAKWKGFFLEPCILKSLKQKNLKKDFLKVWSRKSTIPSFLIGHTVMVYSGKMFKRLTITREKVGYKFGEFCLTRQFTLRQKVIKKGNLNK